MLALTRGKEAALKELDARISTNPAISSGLASERYFYQNFKKQSYIYNLSETVTK
ncbi:hypothetical protein [Mucilaginibacter defluvii]|uniref:hypothetical protein n=1 Tax=Mucilaginibacter defluvii TaxID=1196019 RepID=UPI0031EE3AD5